MFGLLFLYFTFDSLWALNVLPLSLQTRVLDFVFFLYITSFFDDQLVTACLVGMLLKGEVVGSRLTNNLIMELERIYNGGVGVGALQCCESGTHGAGSSHGAGRHTKPKYPCRLGSVHYLMLFIFFT